ncbi:MAG: phosphate/phosphite/phosphonate ABC transporter substrate-binding protein [Rhodospirillaceae bacterium]|nr:phosphate/phosphite/phosphonate ABC transporter substrate-binding protein [Rhodospirillaceae bacterium]
MFQRLAGVAVALICTPYICEVGEAAAAEQCPHGALDARYCDRDGDMVADLPANPKDVIDPDTLVFSYTPVEDPAIFGKVWQNFIAHLEKTTGKKIRFFQVQSNAAQFEALRSGRLHITGANTGGVPVAVNCAGFVPVAMMSAPDTPFASRMEIVVRADSPIQKPEDLKGRTIAFTSPTSNTGYKTPMYLLEKEFGLKVGRDYQSTFSGKHDNSLLGVLNGDYEAGAVADVVIAPMAARGVYDPKLIRTIYRSGPFPTTGYGYAHNLKPELAEKIKAAFLSYRIDLDAPLGNEFPGQSKFIPVSYAKDWEIVRQVDAATGVTYDCK